jgi:hypothetical protein
MRHFQVKNLTAAEYVLLVLTLCSLVEEEHFYLEDESRTLLRNFGVPMIHSQVITTQKAVFFTVTAVRISVLTSTKFYKLW